MKRCFHEDDGTVSKIEVEHLGYDILSGDKNNRDLGLGADRDIYSYEDRATQMMRGGLKLLWYKHID